jgi:transcriptional regulator
MYIPEAFAISDPAKLADVMAQHSFALLVSRDGNSSFASHLPFLFHAQQGKQGTLLSHMARANRHWQLFTPDEEVLVIFQGPHAYISPNWYASTVAVPTWNYATVHAYGKVRLLETDAELDAVLDETVSKHESGFTQPWVPQLPNDMKAKLRQAIVGFKIEVTRLEGKFKLGQNRSREDQEKMLASLAAQPDADSKALADFIKSNRRG